MKKFLLLWFGELLSTIGSGMTAFALSLYVFQVSGKVSDLSILSLLAFIPAVLISPLGGLLADRYDRRLLMIAGDLLSGGCLAYILWILNQPSGQGQPLVAIYVAIGISSIFLGILEPAYKATVTDLIKPEYYDQASGLVQLAASSKFLISPALAGLILTQFNLSFILIIDICTVFITTIIILMIRTTLMNQTKDQVEIPDEQKTRNSLIEDMREGFQIVRQQTGVHQLIFLMFLACFLMAFIQVLIRPMILAIADAQTLGWVESLAAFGLLLGSAYIGVRGIRIRLGQALGIAGMVAGIFIMLLGASRSLVVIVACLFLFFASLPFLNASADALVRQAIPNQRQGRAWGMIGFLTQIGIAVAFLVAGPLADQVFEPLMAVDGPLAVSPLKVLGLGPGRGIGLLLMIVGFLFTLVFAGTLKGKKIKEMELSPHE